MGESVDETSLAEKLHAIEALHIEDRLRTSLNRGTKYVTQTVKRLV
jgi:hypothetical protein